MKGFLSGVLKGAALGTVVALGTSQPAVRGRWLRSCSQLCGQGFRAMERLSAHWKPIANQPRPQWDERWQQGLEAFRATLNETRTRLEAELQSARGTRH